MNVPEFLPGSGVLLRRCRPEDAPALYAIWSDEDVMRYQDMRRHTCPSQADQRLLMLDDRWLAGTEYSFCIQLPHAARGPVGILSCRPLSGAGFAFGFSVARAHWGRGVATSALMLATAWARSVRPGCGLSAATHRHNAACARVLAKAGFLLSDSFMASTALPNLDPGVVREIDVHRRAGPG